MPWRSFLAVFMKSRSGSMRAAKHGSQVPWRYPPYRLVERFEKMLQKVLREDEQSHQPLQARIPDPERYRVMLSRDPRAMPHVHTSSGSHHSSPTTISFWQSCTALPANSKTAWNLIQSTPDAAAMRVMRLDPDACGDFGWAGGGGGRGRGRCGAGTGPVAPPNHRGCWAAPPGRSSAGRHVRRWPPPPLPRPHRNLMCARGRTILLVPCAPPTDEVASCRLPPACCVPARHTASSPGEAPGGAVDGGRLPGAGCTHATVCCRRTPPRHALLCWGKRPPQELMCASTPPWTRCRRVRPPHGLRAACLPQQRRFVAGSIVAPKQCRGSGSAAGGHNDAVRAWYCKLDLPVI